MTHFKELNYKRLDYGDIALEVNKLTQLLTSSLTYEEFLKLFKKIINIQNVIEEMYEYADICNMRNLIDEYWKKEIDYWNEYKPKFDLLFSPFYKICLTTKYKDELSELVPENFFNSILAMDMIMSNDSLELEVEEKNLIKEYRKIVREKLSWNNKLENIPYIAGFFTNEDRNIRKQAHDTINDYYYLKQNELDEIFLDLVKVRNKIARCNNFSNYVDYSLYKRRRFGYDYNDIKNFRDNVKKYIVPLCNKLRKWQQEELGLEKLEYYDSIYFKEMPELLVNDKELLTKFNDTLSFNKKMQSFYNDMLENGYIDLENRDYKVNFNITNYLTDTKLPVITGNLKKNYDALITLCHEFGHAYQKYNSSIKDEDYIVSSLLKYPTFDIAEMFSYGMELILMKYVKNLFNDQDYNKYCFMEIYHLVKGLPEICLVDEFQEKVYSKKDLAKEDIRTIWIKLSEDYNIYKTGHKHLAEGGNVYRVSHIFNDPFYYIDYAISYFGALALYEGCKENMDMFEEAGAVASYYPLNKILNDYGMLNPFNGNNVQELSGILERELVKYKK
jgi:M3 family oligoendopeptidase